MSEGYDLYADTGDGRMGILDQHLKGYLPRVGDEIEYTSDYSISQLIVERVEHKLPGGHPTVWAHITNTRPLSKKERAKAARRDGQ